MLFYVRVFAVQFGSVLRKYPADPNNEFYFGLIIIEKSNQFKLVWISSIFNFLLKSFIKYKKVNFMLSKLTELIYNCKSKILS